MKQKILDLLEKEIEVTEHLLKAGKFLNVYNNMQE